MGHRTIAETFLGKDLYVNATVNDTHARAMCQYDSRQSDQDEDHFTTRQQTQDSHNLQKSEYS